MGLVVGDRTDIARFHGFYHRGSEPDKARKDGDQAADGVDAILHLRPQPAAALVRGGEEAEQRRVRIERTGAGGASTWKFCATSGSSMPFAVPPVSAWGWVSSRWPWKYLTI